MSKSYLADIDLEIAQFYAPYILGSLKFGENRICIWFPGCGKSTVLNDVLRSKPILKFSLGKMYPNFVFYYITGYNQDFLTQVNPNETVNQGKEVVFVVDEIDHLSLQDYSKFVKLLFTKTKLNQRRIHTIINICNREKFENLIAKNPFLFSLSNHVENIKPISDELLDTYIQKKAKVFNVQIDKTDVKTLKKYTGGILFLTKELIRHYPHEGNINAKLKIIWDRLSSSNKQLLLKMGLKIFSNKLSVLELDTKKLQDKYFSERELKIFQYFTKNNGVLTDKESVAKLVWGKDYYDYYSDWAIDQIISRLRRNMIKCNIDSDNLKTVKGKGYLWKK